MKIGVAGAGIMGQLLALSCIEAGFAVTMIDAGTSNCSQAAAGLLAPAAELEKNDVLIYQLGLISITKHWPEILKLLGAEIYFRQLGSLLVAHPDDTAELERLASIIKDKLLDDAAFNLALTDVKSLEPEITKMQRGYYLQQEAQIDNQHLLSVLKKYLIEHGVQWQIDEVLHTLPQKIATKQKIYNFDVVLDCRGLGAKHQIQHLRAMRGELIWLRAPAVNISRPVRLLHPRYSLYVVPRPNQEYLIGASEIEAEDYSEISLQTSLELMTAAYYLHPGFAEARIIKTVTQCRPVTTNHLPVIKTQNGLIEVNGLYRHGFLIAPALAQEVMQYLKSGKQTLIWEQAA